MAREFKNYEIKASPRPIKTGRYRKLSSTVAISTLSGPRQFYCYIAFSDKLVQAVGRKMPRGISEHDPAYLHVDIHPDKYSVYAWYAQGAQPYPNCLMWSGPATEMPKWLNINPVKA